VNETVEALEAMRFNDAANAVYHCVWHELCDWYIELSKEALAGDDAARKEATRTVLVHCLKTSYLLLHPFMPFITEELWGLLRARVGAAWPDSIMEGRYPQTGPVDEVAERAFTPILGIIDALRNIRGEMGIPFKVALGQATAVHVAVADRATHALLEGGEVRRVARMTNAVKLQLHLAQATPRVPQSAVGVGAGFEVRVPLAGVIDLTAEVARIDKELARVDGDLALIEKKLSNPNFVERAPAEVVEKDRARVEELRETRQKLTNHRAVMSGADATQEETTVETNNPNQMHIPAALQPVADKAEQVATAMADAAKEAVQAVQAEANKLEQKAKPVIARAKKAAKKAYGKAKTAVKKARTAAKKVTARRAAKKVAKKPARKPARKPAKKGKKK
jgi:valyl-tRNA synthetase